MHVTVLLHYSDYHSFNSVVINPDPFRTLIMGGGKKTTSVVCGAFMNNVDGDRTVEPAFGSPSLFTDKNFVYHAYDSAIINPDPFRTLIIGDSFQATPLMYGVFQNNVDSDRSLEIDISVLFSSQQLTLELS